MPRPLKSLIFSIALLIVAIATSSVMGGDAKAKTFLNAYNPPPGSPTTGDGVAPGDVGKLGSDPSIVISIDDVVAYDPKTHAVTFSKAGWEKVEKCFADFCNFEICVQGVPVYAGRFYGTGWAEGTSSIVLMSILNGDREVAIELGSPRRAYKGTSDPRPDSRLMEWLEKNGKLAPK